MQRILRQMCGHVAGEQLLFDVILRHPEFCDSLKRLLVSIDFCLQLSLRHA